MKNISDLVLLMVIAVVFLQKKTDSKGNMQHIWIWGVSKTRVAMLCFGYGSHEIHPQQQVGRLRVGWGQGGVWKVSNVSQPSRAQSRSDGLQPSSDGVSVFQT